MPLRILCQIAKIPAYPFVSMGLPMQVRGPKKTPYGTEGAYGSDVI
jgi:hypothetical protein